MTKRAVSLAVLLLSAFASGIAFSEEADSLRVPPENRFKELHAASSLTLSHASLQMLARVSDDFRLLAETGAEFGDVPTEVSGFNPFHGDTEEDYRAFIQLLEAASRSAALTPDLSGYLELARWRLENMGDDVAKRGEQRAAFEKEMIAAKTLADFRALVARYGEHDFALPAKKRLEDLLVTRAKSSTDRPELVIREIQPGMAGGRLHPPKGEKYRATIDSFRGNPYVMLVADYPGDGPYPATVITPMDIMTEGSVHRYRGEYTFTVGEGTITVSGDKADPLTFVALSRIGYVYLHGKGVVTLADGKEVRLGSAD